MENIIHKFTSLKESTSIFIKWVLLSIIVGFIVGIVACIFYYGLSYVTQIRTQHPYIFVFLPIGGLIIVAFYHGLGVKKSQGTNLVIQSIRSEKPIPFKMAPLIFISTLITHLFGGSAGREGAALQLGGSLGQQIGRVLHLNQKDLHIITMAGMSAAFSAIFGTPITATIFSMEVVSVGVLYYAALVPCAFSALIAYFLASFCRIPPERLTITSLPEINWDILLKIILLAVLCAFLSQIFCKILHFTSDFFQSHFKNRISRILVGSVLLIILFTIFGTAYAGAGMDIIEQSLEGQVRTEAFLLKMIFTAITLGCGFKGGEIVPTFFVGATFGCLMGQWLHLSPSLCSALGLIALFCGVTNSPITSLVLSFELFNFTGIYYFLIAVAIAYMLSGYSSLYHEQKIIYSKYSPSYINMKAEDHHEL